ncbi:hypothetical protein LguiB_027548 [Lonicera macranthoides]
MVFFLAREAESCQYVLSRASSSGKSFRLPPIKQITTQQCPQDRPSLVNAHFELIPIGLRYDERINYYKGSSSGPLVFISSLKLKRWIKTTR